MAIEVTDDRKDERVSSLTIGELCQPIDYIMDKNKHGQLPLTHAFERIATALEAKGQ
jgi:hypothetical protein